MVIKEYCCADVLSFEYFAIRLLLRSNYGTLESLVCAMGGSKYGRQTGAHPPSDVCDYSDTLCREHYIQHGYSSSWKGGGRMR